MRPLSVTLALAIPALALTQSTPLKIDFVVTHDELSGGFRDWNSFQINFAKSSGKNRTLYGTALDAQRFGEQDLQFTLGAYNPIAPRLISLVEASVSPTHRILANYAGTAQVQWVVGQGYVMTGGINHTEFRTDRATGFLAGVEKYWGNYRAAYFLSGAEAQNAGFAAGHRLSLNNYLNDRTTLGVTVSLGQEVESIGVGRVIRNDVFGLVLGGRLGVGRSDSVSADIGYFKQGSLYVRRSFSLGYRHAF